MKIVIFEIEPWESAAFEGLERDQELVLEHGRLDAESAANYADADIISTFIYSALDRQVLARFAKLKLVATRSTGFDHIDLDHCAERGVKVANVPSYGETHGGRACLRVAAGA